MTTSLSQRNCKTKWASCSAFGYYTLKGRTPIVFHPFHDKDDTSHQWDELARRDLVSHLKPANVFIESATHESLKIIVKGARKTAQFDRIWYALRRKKDSKLLTALEKLGIISTLLKDSHGSFLMIGVEELPQENIFFEESEENAIKISGMLILRRVGKNCWEPVLY